MDLGNLIKTLRKKNGYTQKELAKVLNLSPTAISAWELNANKPMMDKLSMMSKLFDVPISTFYRFEDKPTNIIEVSQRTVNIPVLGEIACGQPIMVKENFEDYRTAIEDNLPAGDLVYLQAKGDSMYPTIPDGSMVLVRIQEEVENGEIAAITFNLNAHATLKRVKKQGGVTFLMPDNPAHDPIIITRDNPVRIIGKAIRSEQKL